MVLTRSPCTLLVLLLATLAACEGQGSDLGPRIPPLGNVDYRVMVADDQGRAVCGAVVTVTGLSAPGVTGRLGRARVPGRPAGVGLVTIDGAQASATSTDRLGRITVAATLPDGDELPYPIFLPDLANSAGLPLPVGTLSSQAVLDDSGSSGALLTLDAGTSVADGGAASVLLRTGKLAPEHLPGTLPTPASGARVWGQGISIEPATVTFAPSVTLSGPNDLGLSAGDGAELWRLDPQSGQWQLVGNAQADANPARLTASAAIAGGGIFAFAAPVEAVTTLAGRVVDAAQRGVPFPLLSAPGVSTRGDANGAWFLGPLAATDVAGNPRTVRLEVFAGREARPARVTTSVLLTPGVQTVPDLALETTPVGLARLQLVVQGRLVPGRRIGIGTSDVATVGLALGNAQGQVEFDDIAQGTYVGTLTSNVKDAQTVYVADAVQFFGLGQHHVDMQIFGREQAWLTGRRRGGSTNVHVVDELGAGPIRNAIVVRGTTPGQGFVGTTRENGVLSVQIGGGDHATAALTSGAGGRTVSSVCTLADVDSSRLEIPLRRARLQPQGAFDRHGLMQGQMTNGGTGVKTRRIRATRLLVLEDWYDEVVFGRRVAGDVPLKIDPAVTGSVAFELGVPWPAGNAAAVEGATTNGAFAVERLGLAGNLALAEGRRNARDLPLDLAADTPFTIADALTNLDAGFAPTDLAYDWAVELADGTLFDVARGIDGGLTTGGSDLQIALPALTGLLAGGHHWLTLYASGNRGGKTITQRTVTQLVAGSVPTVRFLPVPDIVAPAAGATVAAAGFQVDFSVPPNTLYLELELQSETATDGRHWRAIVPPTYQSFFFRTLPPEAPAILQPGLTWTLTITAARVETGPLVGFGDAYRRVLQNWVGIGPAEREVNAFSSTSIQITTM